MAFLLMTFKPYAFTVYESYSNMIRDQRYCLRKMVVLVGHPAFAVCSAMFIGPDMTSSVALYFSQNSFCFYISNFIKCHDFKSIKTRLEE